MQGAVRPPRIALAATFALLAALACSRPALTLGEACQINTDCADPLVCVIGSCRRQCDAARDCGAGLQCLVPAGSTLGGGCQLDTEVSCALTSECHSDRLVCQNGTCTTPCMTDANCASGAHCTTDSHGVLGCYAVAEPCIYNSDCPDPMICDRDQTCRLECIETRDCVAPRVCSGNLCVLPDAGAMGDGGM